MKELFLHAILILMAAYIAYDTVVIFKKKEYTTWKLVVVLQLILIIAVLYQLYLLGFLQVISDPSRFMSRYFFETKVRIVFLIALASSEILKLKRFKIIK